MSTTTYDAIVIGSGISGGWAAKELTEKGLKTILLERGRNIEHIKDYKNATKAPWEFPHRGAHETYLDKQYPLLSKQHAISEIDVQMWANEKESPYTQIKPFSWYRGYHVGGRSLMWGRQSYRWSDLDFDANAKEGIATDWPIRYKDIAPWYAYVEKFAGISGNLDHLPQLPDGDFLPAMELNCVEKDMATRLKSHYHESRKLIIGRTANLTLPHGNRTNCQYRNKCNLGCPFGGYFSTQSSTLPAAMATGNLTLRPFSIVSRILYDKDTKKATGVEVIDSLNRQTYTYHARVIFLNASALNSAWILMNSATDVWPEGLGSSSNQLGHNIMDHQLGVGAYGTVEGFNDRYYFGRRANGFYIPRFRNLFGDKRDYLRGFGYQGSAGRDGWSRDIGELSIGAAYKEILTEPGSWKVGMGAFGEILPYHQNRVFLDKSCKDNWGLPVLAMDCKIRDNEIRMQADMLQDGVEILEAAGIKDAKTFNHDYVMGGGVHEMGSARMGRDPQSSVLNRYNQVWDALNVYVTDGACMTSSACQNPSLTYMALTARAAAHAVSQLKSLNF